MPDLPASWGLKTQKRNDGKLDIVGKTDAGEQYRVRTTDGPGITDKDITELRAADRENYPNREAGVREFVKNLTGGPEKKPSMIEQVEMARTFDDSEWIAAAEPVVRAGFSKVTLGSTRAYRTGWEKAFEPQVDCWRKGLPIRKGK